MKRDKIFRITIGGVCLALTVISVYAASIVPGVELTLLAVSSLFTAIVLMESGVGSSVLFYCAAMLLGLIIVPNKLSVIPYGFFFGYYGILKYYIEKLHGGLLQTVVKLLFFAGLMCVGLLGFRELFTDSIHIPDMPVALLIIAGILMLFLYDFIYSCLINFYVRRIQRKKGLDDIKLS